jgi:adenosine deaminase
MASKDNPAPSDDGANGQHVPFEVFQALPKTDLHVHLDGSLRLETILELSKQEHIDLPANTADGLSDAIGCGRNFGSLVD